MMLFTKYMYMYQGFYGLEVSGMNFFYVFLTTRQTTKLAFHSNETSKDKLSIIFGYLLLLSRCTPNYTITCSFLHVHYTEALKSS